MHMHAISHLAKQSPTGPVRQGDTASEHQISSVAVGKPVEIAAMSNGMHIVTGAWTSSTLVYTGLWGPIPSSASWQFDQLVSRWHQERGAESSVTKIAMCPAYQKIIAMGPDAVPEILRRLEREGDEPDHWFWALTAITNADPVPYDARGDMVQTAQAWLAWGRSRYAW